ncbi:MAG: prolyl oligopeptidase family serine peptidase [Rickettsiales bacterium]
MQINKIKIILVLSIVLIILYNYNNLNYKKNHMKNSDIEKQILYTKKEIENFAKTEIVPKAEEIKHEFTIHGIKIEDNFAWLKQENWFNEKKFTNLNIPKYLESESEYANKYFKFSNWLTNSLFEEIKARTKEDDISYPLQYDDQPFAYFSETKSGLNYAIQKRKNLNTQKEEVILDANLLAKGKDYFDLSFSAISPKHNLLAYGVNYDGGENFTIQVKDLNTNKNLDVNIEKTLHSIVWLNENEFLYTPVSDVWISKVIMHYNIEKNQHTKIYEEKMKNFSVNVGKFANEDFFYLISSNGGSEKIRIFKQNDVNFNNDLDSQAIYTIEPKEHVDYDITIQKDILYILTNEDNCPNNKIFQVNLNTKEKTIYIDHDQKYYLQSISATKDYLIINYKEEGLDKIDIIQTINSQKKTINFEDKAYTASLYHANYFDNDILYVYSSPKMPQSLYRYDFNLNKSTKVKEKEIPVPYNPNDYEVERVFVGPDKIPMTLLYKKSLFKKDGSNNAFVIGYGAYGIQMKPAFNNNIFPLVDRGYIYAITHIRGGSEINENWHLNGKLLNKKNTFNDFHACIEYLIENKYTSSGGVAIDSASAGGLLIGNALNSISHHLSCAVANAPFVDLINTMLDDKAPLTENEYLEWGNPNNKREFEYMLSYDPYLNAKGDKYPPLFITTGLNDPRVSYHEPAKWVAKIRTQKAKMNTNPNNIVIFNINMNQGHFNSSGRYDYMKDLAKKYTFILLNKK